LWYREPQCLKNLAYQKTQVIQDPSRAEPGGYPGVELVVSQEELVEGKSVLPQEPDLIMETDASMLGWERSTRAHKWEDSGLMWSI